jgi:nucleoside-diphosphate-sugar epimerase
MKILITGIHGFVGNHLVDYLKNKHTLYGLDIVSPFKQGVEKTFGWSEMDAIPAVNVIIHLAGKAHDTKNQTDAKAYFDINTGLTQQIFDWFVLTNARKFIFLSSVKAAAEIVENNVLTEESIPAPKGPYGESKLAAEAFITAHMPADKLVYILRPCMIHGSGNKGNLNLLYELQKKGLPWPLGAYKNSRSFCSVENLSFVVEQFISMEITSGIYQVADDEAMSTNELIKLIAFSQNKKPRIWKIPVIIINTIARLGDFLHLPVNSPQLKKLTESYLVSNLKLKHALGIDNMPVTAIEGLQNTFETFKK